MDKQQIIDYIMHTPSNTNPAMLGQFLDEYSGGSGESWSIFFEGEVTTQEYYNMYATLLSNSGINVNKIKVIFNDTEYECNKIVSNNINYYGGFSSEGPVFSEYPFVIETNPEESRLYTESLGTYSIKIEVPQESESSGSSESSNDWSIAEVTFISEGDGTVTIPHIAQVPEEQAELLPVNTVLMTTGHLDEETTTFQVPLYKGCYVFESSGKFTVSGNITQLNTRMAIITGNCTITLGTFN